MNNNSSQIDETKLKNPAHFFIGSLLVIFGFLAVLSGIKSISDNKSVLYTPNSRLKIERAITQSERQQGLSNRQTLEKDSGMLFVFEDSDKHCFWMKDTFIPLDIVWLDGDKKVVFVHENAKVQSEDPICPDNLASYVLEVSAGQAKELGLTAGAQVRF